MKLIKIVLFIISITFASNVVAQTVYTTKTGEKYHKASCRFLKYSKKETTIKKAKALGYAACKVCKPTIENTKANPDIVSSLETKTQDNNTETSSKKTTASRCTGKTKKGLRCKRMTKNSNGRCYQH